MLLLLDKWMAIARRAWGVWSNFCQDGKWLEGFGLDQRKQLSIVVGMQNLVQTTWSIMVLIKSKIVVRGRVPMWKRLGSIQLDNMLRKASVARVNRRLLRYYLIVRLLPNVFALACRS